MAIAFNLPSEREASEENFSRLNRLLAELYDVLCHILVARQGPGPEPAAREAHEAPERRERPYSESDLQRPTTTRAQHYRRSASSPPLTLTLDSELDDDVFVSPRTDSGNDLFSTKRVEIFGYDSPRTPAGLLLSPRRERYFTFSVKDEKHWRDKGGTEEELADTDVTDAASPTDSEPSHKEPSSSTSSEGSIFSSILPDKLSGSICTAVLFMVGWKLFSKR